MTHRLVVLVSGSGSNLQAIIDAIADGGLEATITAVISNRASAFALERAAAAGIATQVINNADHPDRDSFDRALVSAIDAAGADTVVLAGFMRILTPAFVRHYHGRLLNIHPSLLPRHRGLDTHARALDAGDSEHGCSIHFVTEQLDGGPLVAQARFSVDRNDCADSLSKKVQQLEHQLYPLVLRWRAQQRLCWTDDGVLLDDTPVAENGIQFDQRSGIADLPRVASGSR
ncbi:MAG: phosphoribosylglycinamide formyltransferase [Alcanivoracaceae bacterium]